MAPPQAHWRAPAPALSAAPPKLEPKRVAGSAALYEDYQRCLKSLEELISGGLQVRKEELTAAARSIEANMEAVQQVQAAVQAETDYDAAAITERLEAAARQKLVLLQHDLSSHLLEIEAIEGFVAEVVDGVGPSDAAASGAEQALQLLRRQPELTRRAQRMLQKPLPPCRTIDADDLPREAAERARRLEHAETLDRLLQVKDSMLWSMLHDAQAKDASHSEREEELEQMTRYVASLRSDSEQELRQWSELADEYQRRLNAVASRLAESELDAAEARAEATRAQSDIQSAREEAEAARAEAELLRNHAAQLRAQNEELRAHSEQLRLRLMQGQAG